ncbi:MAG: hypothetical protein WC956_08715 [bacterium]
MTLNDIGKYFAEAVVSFLMSPIAACGPAKTVETPIKTSAEISPMPRTTESINPEQICRDFIDRVAVADHGAFKTLLWSTADSCLEDCNSIKGGGGKGNRQCQCAQDPAVNTMEQLRACLWRPE